MFTSPQNRARRSSLRHQLVAFTTTFLLLQSAFFIAPATSGKQSSGKRNVPVLLVSTSVVISQVYGGAGCGTAGCSTYKNDYFELFNRGASPQSLGGWSVQYASATGTAWQVTPLTNVTLQPGQYYLVAESFGANGVNNLPTADVTGTIAMSATAAKVALVNTTTALTGSCPTGASIVDLVGYGSTASCFETAVAPAPSTTTADVRAGNGCTETDNNSTDFTATTPNPRNTSTATNPCGGGGTPTLNIGDVTQAEGNAGQTAFNFSVSLTSPAGVGGVTFNASTADGTTNPANAGSDYDALTNQPFTITEGNTSTTVTVQVNGDTTSEPNETFFVNITNVSGANTGDGQGIGTITNDDGVLAAIHEIQGSGTASPFAGQTVTTTGVVTLLKTSTNTGGAASGFFIQTPDANADADPNTSQGIFVFTSTVPTVAVGDEVTVTGTVVEFFDMTEISPVTNVSVIDTGNPLPTPVTLTTTILDPAALPTQPQLEKYEGMRMSSASLKTVAPNDNFFDVDVVLTGVPRPLREPGIEISLPVPPDPTTGVPDCCIPRWDENPERLNVDTNGRAGAPLNPYTSNVVFSNVAGPLDFAFNEYRLIADATPSATANMSAVPLPTPTGNEFTVAGYNIENFDNNATQRQKAALAIRDVLRLPYIIGVAEIFDLADLQALATEINTISPPGTTYQAYLVEADGTSEDSDQDVGYLVDTSRVQVNSVVQRNATETYTNPNNGQQELLNDRPPLVLNANINPAGANLPVIVVVNHLRSFIDIELVTGEGPRVRAKRKAQAESLAALLQEYQTNNPTTSVISVGDYNAYQFSDGYTDPIATIKGNPTPDDQIVVDQSPDVVNPNFLNLVDELAPEERYSFIFEGTPQALDHVIVNTIAHGRNTRFLIARNNADFPEVPAAAFASNAARPERNSDHDMPLAYFSLAGAQAAGSILISEFRLRGPGPVGTLPERNGTTSPEASDEWVEIYNNTDSAITVATTDGSAGWAVAASDGVARFTIPNGTVIPARGHFLGVNSDGYSLGGYPAGNGTTATGDATFAIDIPDNAGIALFNTSNAANFVLANRLDAVGSASEANTLYKEGTGYPALNPLLNPEHSWFRNLASGLPKDTDNNAADFLFADTQATTAGPPVRLGAPGPENLSSPIQRNATIKAFPIDNGCPTSSGAPPAQLTTCARHRDPTAGPNASQGTLSIRRNFKNNTGSPVTRLRFRAVDMTTFPAAAGAADLRLLTSSTYSATCVSTGGGCTAPGNVITIEGTTKEEPPTQPNGGGLNSSVSAGTITLLAPLAPGASINLQFLLGVQTGGAYRFFINVEALP